VCIDLREPTNKSRSNNIMMMMSIRSSRGMQRSDSYSFNLRRLVYLLVLCLFVCISVSNTKRIADEANLQLHISALSAPSSSSTAFLHQLTTDHVNVHPLNTDNRIRQVEDTVFLNQDETPVCRVALVNKADYHYEIIESTILQFPLPWEKLGCNVTTIGNKKPIIAFDVALAEHHKIGNEKEGWIDYFTTSLKGRVTNRTDGLVRAQFGEIFSYMNFTQSYSAVIGVSCDSSNYKRWMNGPNKTNFCVLHGTTKFKDPWILERSCWLNPMHERCFFLPTDFPQFAPTQQEQKSRATINLCVSGADRHHGELAQVLANAPKNVTQSLRLRLLQRHPDIPKYYIKRNLSDMVDIIHTSSFMEFQKAISECDVLLPLIDPERNKDYFPKGLKKLSGSLPQVSCMITIHGL
jgi:hypothetical protein